MMRLSDLWLDFAHLCTAIRDDDDAEACSERCNYWANMALAVIGLVPPDTYYMKLLQASGFK